jgi:hypothetical protein
MEEKSTSLGEFDGVPAIGPGGYVSYASLGAGIGTIFPGVGTIAGAVIGGIVDLAISARSKKKERKALQKAFYAQLLKRYNTQLFISALERMGPAMVYLQTLGLKPGTPGFDVALTKKLRSEIGYKGRCSIDILGPAAAGKKRPVIASIDSRGKMQAFNPHIDNALGPKWLEACKEFHKAALKAWAMEQKENILFQRDIDKEKQEAKRAMVTRLLINAGIILGLAGYSIRQKKKLKYMRQLKAQRRASKPKLQADSGE